MSWHSGGTGHFLASIGTRLGGTWIPSKFLIIKACFRCHISPREASRIRKKGEEEERMSPNFPKRKGRKEKDSLELDPLASIKLDFFS
jgi:hypothetical protein